MSGISIAKERRPLAMFEYGDNGQQVIVKIMQHGDKFSVTEKNADDWLAQIENMARAGQYDPAWVAQFKMEYEAFLKGNELPRDGTPVRTWGAITREQGNRLIGLNLTTLEDLAATPDSGLGQIGLDGRYLRDLAKNTLESAKGTGDLAKKLAAAEQKARDQDETIKRMGAQIEEMKALLPDKKKAA